MTDWIAEEKKYYMQTRRQPIVIVRGLGAKVWDEHGKEYLDFTAGWAVNNIGHCHPAVVKAVQEQVATLTQTSNQFFTVPQLKLAKLLVESSGMGKVFFCNSGAEANEGAIKLARKYGKLHKSGAYEVIAADNSFHGRTLTTVAATGNVHYQEPFTPMPDGFKHVPFGDIEAIKLATTPKTVAVLLEPVQGEGGVNVPPPDYLRQVRQWCTERGLLLILDEVQTGMGRLGTLFGFQRYQADPDVITLAKGLGGGVPVGAFLAKDSCAVLVPGEHGSTFGGNPLVCAAALASTEWLIDHKIWENARKMGERLMRGLNDLYKSFPKEIKEVRGVGLLQGVETREDVAGAVITACNAEGLLLNPARPNVVRFMPPLTITEQDVDEALVRLSRACAKVFSVKA
ncbi:MAG: aspartate aminotransferase family protein [Dehalococcoidia bacterium]|nr:aspartate aminotransferase family protein [Dehalococcoidia bacterium]